MTAVFCFAVAAAGKAKYVVGWQVGVINLNLGMNTSGVPFCVIAIDCCEPSRCNFYGKLSLIRACRRCIGDFVRSFYSHRIKAKVIEGSGGRFAGFGKASCVNSSDFAGTEMAMTTATGAKIHHQGFGKFAWAQWRH
jgi:hypothetical protein